jgi:hypothetical protein
MTTMLNKDNQDRGFFILHSPKPELLKNNDLAARLGWRRARQRARSIGLLALKALKQCYVVARVPDWDRG